MIKGLSFSIGYLALQIIGLLFLIALIAKFPVLFLLLVGGGVLYLIWWWGYQSGHEKGYKDGVKHQEQTFDKYWQQTQKNAI